MQIEDWVLLNKTRQHTSQALRLSRQKTPPPTYKIPATSMIIVMMQLIALSAGVRISLRSASKFDNKSEQERCFPER